MLSAEDRQFWVSTHGPALDRELYQQADFAVVSGLGGKLRNKLVELLRFTWRFRKEFKLTDALKPVRPVHRVITCPCQLRNRGGAHRRGARYPTCSDCGGPK